MPTVNDYIKSRGLAPQVLPNGNVEFPPLTVGQALGAAKRREINMRGGKTIHREENLIPDMLYEERLGPHVFPETQYQNQERVDLNEVLQNERQAYIATDLQPPNAKALDEDTVGANRIGSDFDSYASQWGIGFLEYAKYRLGMYRNQVEEVRKMSEDLASGMNLDEDASVKQADKNWNWLGSNMMDAGRQVHQYVGDAGRYGWQQLESGMDYLAGLPGRFGQSAEAAPPVEAAVSDLAPPKIANFNFPTVSGELYENPYPEGYEYSLGAKQNMMFENVPTIEQVDGLDFPIAPDMQLLPPTGSLGVRKRFSTPESMDEYNELIARGRRHQLHPYRGSAPTSWLEYFPNLR